MTEVMSWDVWMNRMLSLAQDITLVSKCPYDPFKATDKGFEFFLQILFANESLYRSASDADVRQFIKTKTWPLMNPWPQYITYVRIQAAADFTCQLTMRDTSGFILPYPSQDNEASVLEWLLIDHWHRVFDTWLKLLAVSLFYGLPFYGPSQAPE